MFSSVAQVVACILFIVLTFIVAALLAFVPLTALPGDLQTDFINGHGVKLAYVAILGLVMYVRLAPFARAQSSWSDAPRFAWAFISSFVALFWSVGLLTWLNAYGVQKGRTHDMMVTAFESTRSRSGASAIENYKLTETATGWKADMEVTDARDTFARQGSCVRITVRDGRLGLDWISDAQPIGCPDALIRNP